MNLIDVLIPLIPGIVLIAFPGVLTPKTATPEEAAKNKSKLRKIGYVLVSVAVLYFFLTVLQPQSSPPQ
jgi:hypothetical protein